MNGDKGFIAGWHNAINTPETATVPAGYGYTEEQNRKPLIEVQHIPAHFNARANSLIPAAWLAVIVRGPEDCEGVQSRWHDRQGAIDGAISELPESLRRHVRIVDAVAKGGAK